MNHGHDTNADGRSDADRASDQGGVKQNAATGYSTFPFPAPAMSSDAKVDNITGGGDKPQYDAGEEP